ncbi:TMEM175 family protein, partial [Jeotgalibacillus marinus]
MILFSDAVFAIAITLLIIEIKFPELPEDHPGQVDLLKLFGPTLKGFLAFAVSFFFIGVSWARHLKMFRYLRAYDGRVIFLNLFSLFFIVT